MHFELDVKGDVERLTSNATGDLPPVQSTRPVLKEDPAAFARWLKRVLLDMADRGLWFQDKTAKSAFRFSIDVQLSAIINEQLPLGTLRRVIVCPGLELEITPLTPGFDLDLRCTDNGIRARYDAILGEIDKRWPAANALVALEPPNAGRHHNGRGPNRKELIDRLARAQKANELAAADPDARSPELRLEVEWDYGGNAESARTMFGTARRHVRALETRDPEDLLSKISKYREEQGF